MYYVNPIIKSFLRTNQPEGRGKYVRLDQNENPDGIPQWLFDKAMAKVTPEYLSIYPEESRLTEEYAKVIGFGPENIALTDGSVVAMGYVIKVFGEPGKDLVCVTPTFGMYKVYADMQGMNTKFVHYEKDYTFDIEKLLAEINESTSLVSLVNPNMPIGNAYAMDEIRKVLDKAKANNALVIVDEAYYLFHKETALPLLKEYDNLVILRTFSKMLSMPGLRVGVVISSAENAQYIRNYKPHYTVNAVALAVAEEMVANYDRVVKELTEKFEGGKKCLLEALDKTGYSYIPTEGCFICITPKHRTAEYITDELKNRGILIFCGKGDSAGFLRVTIWDRKYMEMFMKELVQIDVPEGV
jgi:histidinol-phosphate aminotransferase